MNQYTVPDYMENRRWEADNQLARKRYQLHLAQESKYDRDIASKIGGMLIYNQLIEQCLTDIVKNSIYYIKAELWPVEAEMDIDIDKATFGKVIDYFRQFATVEPNRELILSYLKRHNSKRNLVVHDLFDIEDLGKLAHELDDFADLADEILNLLMEYDEQVRANFRGLSRRVDFSNPPRR